MVLVWWNWLWFWNGSCCWLDQLCISRLSITFWCCCNWWFRILVSWCCFIAGLFSRMSGILCFMLDASFFRVSRTIASELWCSLYCCKRFRSSFISLLLCWRWCFHPFEGTFAKLYWQAQTVGISSQRLTIVSFFEQVFKFNRVDSCWIYLDAFADKYFELSNHCWVPAYLPP